MWQARSNKAWLSKETGFVLKTPEDSTCPPKSTINHLRNKFHENQFTSSSWLQGNTCYANAERYNGGFWDSFTQTKIIQR